MSKSLGNSGTSEFAPMQPDLLDRAAFLARLERYIATEQRFINGSLVVSLSAPFGSGKTTFLEIWKGSISKQVASQAKGEAANPPLVVSINAWDSDYYADPLVAIMLSILEAFKGRDEEAAKKITQGFGIALRFLAGGSREIVRAASKASLAGFDTVDAFEACSDGAISKEKPMHGVQDYLERKDRIAEMKWLIRDACGGDGIRTYIFIDELDRCRPDFSVSYLEVIKHLFDIKGVVFVLAVDEGQLESATKAVFGADLNFKEYLRKFVHRTVALPPVLSLSESNVTTLVEKYMKHYLGASDNLVAYRPLIEFAAGLIAVRHVTPRQLQEVMRVMAHARYHKDRKPERCDFPQDAALFLMSFLRVVSPASYEAFGRQDHAFPELHGILAELSGLGQYRYQETLNHRFSLFAHGFKISDPKVLEALQEYLPKYFKGSPAEMLTEFNRICPGVGFRFRDVYKDIESLLTLEG